MFYKKIVVIDILDSSVYLVYLVRIVIINLSLCVDFFKFGDYIVWDRLYGILYYVVVIVVNIERNIVEVIYWIKKKGERMEIKKEEFDLKM